MDAVYSEILTGEYNKKEIISCVQKLKQCIYIYISVALIPPFIPFYTPVLRSTTDTTIKSRTFMRRTMRVLDCIVTILFGVYLLLWLFYLVL